MINPINHYAITSGQPGVINEEAYTVLQLVGQIGAKVNECAEQVNENTQATGEFDARITAAQETADGAQETANQALSITNENEQRITHVSSVALEGRSVAYAAQALSEQNADLLSEANTDIVELKNAVKVTALNLSADYSAIVTAGEPGQVGELSIQWRGGVLPIFLYPAFATIKRNLLESESSTGNAYEFVLRDIESTADEGVYLNGSLKIYLIPRNSEAHGSRSSFTFELNLNYATDNNYVRADAGIYTIFGSGSITNGDYSVSGIPVSAVYINTFANWIYNAGQI